MPETGKGLADRRVSPQAVRQVLILKNQAGRYRPAGIPCSCDRVVQTTAALVLAPTFKAVLRLEPYA